MLKFSKIGTSFLKSIFQFCEMVVFLRMFKKILKLCRSNTLIIFRVIIMFKFNFSVNDEDTLEKDDIKEIKWYESKEITLPIDMEDFMLKISKLGLNKIDYGNGLNFTCLSPSEVINNLTRPGEDEFWDAVKADKLHSDLVTGKYEGGLKTWECTKDLAIYFFFNVIDKMKTAFEGKFILDLGCGSGLLGILCLKSGGHVTFQDYNQEVLEMMTIPNILLNCKNYLKKVRFYSGDWSSFVKLFLEKNEKHIRFDYILTSETIYNTDNYEKLITVFKELVKPDGVIYVAAKCHYFGVGGSLLEFMTKVIANGMDCKVVMETSEGVARKIVEVTVKKTNNDKKEFESSNE